MVSLSDRSAQQSIVERLSRLQADTPRRWGRMTASQMLCHLDDSFLVSFGEKEASSLANIFSKTAMKFVALRVPAPWPKGVRTLPEVEQGAGGTCPTDFSTDKDRLLHTLSRFCVPDPKIGRYPHPLFGQMSVAEWLRWGYLHSDHHLRQFGM